VELTIKGDSLRLRLSQEEMRTLTELGEAADRVSFPGGSALKYRLRVDNNIRHISASYDENLLDIRVPQALSERWCASYLATLSGSQPLAAGELHIVLEKD